MKKLLIYFSILFFFAIFLLPEKTFAVENSLERIFYLPQYNAVKGVESLSKNWKNIDIVAPQMHVMNSKFVISGGFGPKLKKLIKDHNLKVMPLIANANFSQTTMHNLLTSQVGQDKVINYLIKGALTNGYIGWQFDFENISYKDRDLYSAFVEKAAKSFKDNNLILSVVAVVRSVDYEDTNAFKNWSGVYDYKRLSDAVDFISLMAYDDPESQGPTASIPFVNKILAYVKDKIPSQKISLGIPTYYWKWNVDTGKKLGSGFFNNIINLMSKYRYTLGFDKTLGVSWLSYKYSGKNYAVWFEDKNSFEAKLNIIKENNLRGFSAWLLGGEDPEIWNILSETR